MAGCIGRSQGVFAHHWRFPGGKISRNRRLQPRFGTFWLIFRRVTRMAYPMLDGYNDYK